MPSPGRPRSAWWAFGSLVAIGNFTFVDGLLWDQVAMWHLGASADLRTDRQTHRYEPACFSWAYDSYIRDVDFSPDGSYFVIAATGGGNGTICDAAARFETDAAAPTRPTWINYTGGDTLHSVAVTDKAVYVQGHQRWLDNPQGHDNAGPGASRPAGGRRGLDDRPAPAARTCWSPRVGCGWRATPRTSGTRRAPGSRCCRSSRSSPSSGSSRSSSRSSLRCGGR